jgi:glycosyltransferase involved in cell wall biosynthesis
VGITRTEIEFAHCVLSRHPSTVLTYFDLEHRRHVVLSEDDWAALVADPAAVKPATGSVSAAGESELSGQGRRPATVGGWQAGLEMAGLLIALLVVPAGTSWYRKLKRHALWRMAKNSTRLPARWSDYFERKLRAHPTRDKYLLDYQRLKEMAGNRVSSTSAERSAEPLDFGHIDAYISVGCGWDMNDFEVIHAEKRKHGFKVVTCVYDLVPIVMPDVMAPRLNDLFLPYICNLLWASDTVACISESTKSDLECFIAESGAPRPHIEVCRLGWDAVATHGVQPAVAAKLRGRDFALYVATLEPRKNHAFLYFLWKQLVRRGNVEAIPLVLAGRNGWRTENLREQMQLDGNIWDKCLFRAEDLTDPEVTWLYRHCRFTVFPALYEGWGLPVSESLAHGKVCIAAKNSSIPEAGQGLAREIDLLDGRKWIEEIERCISDDEYLRSCEAAIRRGFRVRPWEESGNEFVSLIEATCGDAEHVSNQGRVKARPAYEL